MSNSYGQTSNYRLKGQLEDTFSFSIPYNTDIVLLKNKDTVAKGNSGNKHSFQLSVNEPGFYRLCISHPDYFPVDSPVIIKDPITALGFIELRPKSKLLDEVVVKYNFTSRINKDTMEFTADSFLIKQFSSAKELLGKIPGIRIDLNGNITYNGKPISEVSLDGIPFLSMSPDKLLNLIRGKDIDKIKLFDIKSRMARMTGIDDNSKGTGLNLTLKEEAKNGYYGKLASGIGASKSAAQWDNSGNINSFNDNRRVMLNIGMNNTGATSAINEMNLAQLSSPPEGQPKYLTGGGHYDTRLLKDNKLSLSIDYSATLNEQQTTTSANSINLIPGNEFKTCDISAYKTTGQIHNLNIASGYQLSTSSFINVTLNSSINTGNGNSQNESGSYNLDGNFLNSSSTQNTSKYSSPNTLANILYTKTFDKAGRSLNLSFTSNLNGSKTDIEQVSNSRFSTSPLDEKIRQQKYNDQNSGSNTLNIHYTEPLRKGLNLNLDFITNINNALSGNRTYDIFEEDNQLADSLNPLYSNNFSSKNFMNRINVALQFQAKKCFFSLGGDVSHLNWDQYDLTNGISLQKKYFNILPAATLRYNMNSHSVFSLDFRAQTAQPQLAQIQPISYNNDPLHILAGNPDLTQSYTYNLSLNYSNSKPSVFRYFNANTSFSFTQNAISLKQYYTTDGKEVSRYYNVDGNYNGNISFNYNLRLFSKVQVTAGENISVSKSISTLNNNENHVIEQHYGTNVSLAYMIDTLLNISYFLSFDYSLSHSSLIENSANKIWNSMQNLDIIYSLPKGFSFASRFNWNLRPKTGPQDQSYNIFFCNLSIGKTIGKKEAVTLKLLAYDVFNQNKSYFVYYGANIRSERTSNTIGRYIMLGLVWNFTKRQH